MDVDGDWKEDSQLSDILRTKVLSLKLCRHRCIAQAKSESPMDIASPVFKMLTTLLHHDGLLSDKIITRYFPSHPTSTLSDEFYVQSERTITVETTSCSLYGILVSDRYLCSSHSAAFRLVGSDDTGTYRVVANPARYLKTPRRIRVFTSVPVS